MKIGVIGQVHESAIQLLKESVQAEVVCVPDGGEDAIRPAVDGAAAILLRTSKLTPTLLDQAPDLQVVSRHGVGFDNVPWEYMNGRKIPIAVSANANMISVAEHAIAMMLALAKCFAASDHAVRHDQWNARNKLQLFELAGKTLLIVGFGRIGKQVARRARAFAMDTVVYDPFVGDDLIETTGCKRAAVLEEDIGLADIVTLHLPSNERTRGLFSSAMFERMKPGSILINTARGGIVDEDALAQALRSGHLHSAGIDVLEKEPPPRGHALFACHNLLLSPHMAGVTGESLARMGLEAAQNIIDILNGQLDPNVIVNFDEIHAT